MSNMKLKAAAFAAVVSVLPYAGAAQAETIVTGGKTIAYSKILNCGYATESGNRTTGTRDGGNMAIYNYDCTNEKKFSYQDTENVPISVDGERVRMRAGTSHWGCKTDDSAVLESTNKIDNANANYIIVHRDGDKHKAWVVAIPSDVGLSCNLLWRSGKVYNRYREIK